MAGRNKGFEEEPQGFEHGESPLSALPAPSVRAVVGEGGRLVIPAGMRKAMGIKPGDTVSLRLEEDALKVTSAKMALETVRKLARKFKKPGVDLVDEFLAERREEAARELDEANAWRRERGLPPLADE